MAYSKRLTPYIICAWLLASCSKEGDGDAALYSDAAVSFATDVAETTTRASITNIANLDTLKKLGVNEGAFGVFAYLTDDALYPKDPYPTKESLASFTDFFFLNQPVWWGVQYVKTEILDGEEVQTSMRDWVYSPLKYWPNSNANLTPRRISFFAYAPYTEATAASAQTTGITGMTDSDDKTPHIDYVLGSVGSQTDLLWANCTDATRNGQGLIVLDGDGGREYQKVPLIFHHALACLEVMVQRVYDEPDYSGKSPLHSDTLFVSRLELNTGSESSAAIYGGGRFRLDKGEWESLSEISKTDGDYKLVYTETMFNDSVSGTNASGTTKSDTLYIRDRELDKVGTPGFGIDETERHLFPLDHQLFFLPQELTFTPTLTYSMVTSDDKLQLKPIADTEGHLHYRRQNTTTGNPFTINFKAGKRYRLVIHVGVEHIDFELVSIEDWDFPLRFSTGTTIEPLQDEDIVKPPFNEPDDQQ